MARATHQITCHKPNPSICKDYLGVDSELDIGLSIERGHTDRQRQELEDII